MSKLHAFNMFQQQEGGFTQIFVSECGKVLRDHVDELLKIINKDEIFDELNSSNYEITRSFLKESILEIGDCHFYLYEHHLSFLQEQRVLVLELCGAELVDALKYTVDMNSITHEITMQMEECQQGIDNMVAYEDFTRELYEEYKSNLVIQLVGMKDKNAVYIELLFKEHVNNKWDALDQLNASYSRILLKFHEATRLVEEDILDAHKELKFLKEELGKLRYKITQPVRADTLSKLDAIWSEVTNLSIDDTLDKHFNRWKNWIDYINQFNKVLKETLDDLYDAEIVMNGMKLKGPVDLRSIQRCDITKEEKHRILFLTIQLERMLSRCLILGDEEVQTLQDLVTLKEEK